jgi:hypothetical protein
VRARPPRDVRGGRTLTRRREPEARQVTDR